MPMLDDGLTLFLFDGEFRLSFYHLLRYESFVTFSYILLEIFYLENWFVQ